MGRLASAEHTGNSLTKEEEEKKKHAEATLVGPDRRSRSIWPLPSSIRCESGCSSAGRWCLPPGSRPGNYCWGTSHPILSCGGEKKKIYELLSQKTGPVFRLMYHAAVQQEMESASRDQVLENPRKTHLYEREVDWGWELLLPSRDPPGGTKNPKQSHFWKNDINTHNNRLINFLAASKRVISYFLKHVEEQKNCQEQEKCSE